MVPFEESPTAPEELSWELTSEERAALPDSAFLWIDPRYASGESRDKKLRKGPHHDARGRVVWRAVAALAAVLEGARGGIDIPGEDVPAARAHIAAHYHQFGRTAPWEKKSRQEEQLKGKTNEEELRAARLIADAVLEAVEKLSLQPASPGKRAEKSDELPTLKERVEGLGERLGKLEAAFGRASLPGQEAARKKGSIWKGVF